MKEKSLKKGILKKGIFYFFIVSIIFFFASNVFAFKSCQNLGHDIIGKILSKQGIDLYGSGETYTYVCGYLQVISNFESADENLQNNVASSAKGYFQFVNGTFDLTLKNILALDSSFPKKDHIYDYSYSEQSQFAMMLWYKGGGNSAMKGIAEGDIGIGKKVYCKYHHTDCGGGQITEKRNERLNSMLKNWGQKGYIPSSNTEEGRKKIDDDYTVDGIPLGYKLKKMDLKAIADKKLKEICNGSRKYGLVGFDGGICKEYGGDQRSGFVAFVATVQKALNWVIGLAFMIAVMVLFYAGFLLLSGNPNKKSQAKTVLVNVVIGLFLIATAWLLVDWIFTLFGVDDSFKFTSVG